jgi:hypothetical protein
MRTAWIKFVDTGMIEFRREVSVLEASGIVAGCPEGVVV